MTRSFELKNDGSLDISKILLMTDYTVTDAKNDNAGADFGKHIQVNFLLNADKIDSVVFGTTLAELKTMTPDAIENEIFIKALEERGKLKAGTSDQLYVNYEFVDNKADQNMFQGDKLELIWTFEAMQTKGQDR